MNETRKLVDEIVRLKTDRNAVILAHNYQIGPVQDIADFCGDSLELSRKAQSVDADVIVFCGVHFMAETAALLSPQKTVLLPDLGAGCPMADMADASDVAHVRSEHPDAIVVCYVNSSAAVKALSHVCCTSANAVEIVSRIPEDKEIIFVPDQYLGGFVERNTGRKLILWPGYCSIHALLSPEHIHTARAQYPGASVMTHPECKPEVAELSDEVLSTGGMCRFAQTSDKDTIVVGTETGLIHRLRKENPQKTFVPLSENAVCPNMKKIDLEKVRSALETLSPRVTVTDDIAVAAHRAIDQMLQDGPIVN